MSGTKSPVVIVGGGLAGLVAAMRLGEACIRDLTLVEAREALGGRIAGVDAEGVAAQGALPAPDGFDLGPTWFWPDLQPRFKRLVDDLGLQCVEQFEEGDMLVERSAREAPMRVPGYASAPPAMRLIGGTGAIVTALCKRLDLRGLYTGHGVRRLRRVGERVDVEIEGASRAFATLPAAHVMLALPPRLAARRIAFDPPLPPELAQRWRATPTWMAPHAKYVAIYETPFWRDQGLSGAARSALGPMAEIHDHSMPGGRGALFGFIGVPASVRRPMSNDALKALCRAQLGRLLGEHARVPRADALKDWALDPLTATQDDQDPSGHLEAAPPAEALDGAWHQRLTGIGSEWSRAFPGYMAGALDAAERGVRRYLDAITRSSHSPAR